jgi:hypothetical protein
MSIPPSTAGNLPLPQWAYVPGETAEAEADHETLWQAKALVPSRFRGYVPARHPALRYAMALNDNGYFWESQEILEALWAAAPQGGRERILLRACIQIAKRQFAAPDAKAARGGAVFRRGARRTQCAWAPQRGCVRRWIRRCFPDRRACRASEGQIGLVSIIQGGLDKTGRNRANMNQNAVFGARKALDCVQSMHYYAC